MLADGLNEIPDDAMNIIERFVILLLESYQVVTLSRCVNRIIQIVFNNNIGILKELK